MCLLSMGEIISECFKMTNKNEIIIAHCFLWIVICVFFFFFDGNIQQSPLLDAGP